MSAAKSPSNPGSGSQPATTTTTTSTTTKPRILCLHGKYQSGAIFSNKIAGARRKLERRYDLEFLDGPIRLPNLQSGGSRGDGSGSGGGSADNDKDDDPAYFAWWLKDEATGQHTLVKEGLEYVLQHIHQNAPHNGDYEAVIGFSQGGVVATALCCSGLVPSLRAVVTAGSPMVAEAFVVADAMAQTNARAGTPTDHESTTATLTTTAGAGYTVPKLHLAGETDAMIPVSSTQALCERGGQGQLLQHDQGHLFPTRSVRVQAVLDFLETSLSPPVITAAAAVEEERPERK